MPRPRTAVKGTGTRASKAASAPAAKGTAKRVAKRTAKKAAAEPTAPPPDDAGAIVRDDALGRAIMIRRVELGLSRRALAERAGLSYPYVSELERGAKTPSSPSLYALAAALDLAPGALLDRAESLRAGDDPTVDARRRVPRTASGPGGARAASRPAGATGGMAARRPDRGSERDALGPPDAAGALADVVRSIVRDELARHPIGGGRSVRAGPASHETDRAGTLARTAPEHDDDTLAPGITEEELRAGVLESARALLDDPDLAYDDEGDLPIRRNDVMLFIRVLDDPLSVLIFSPVLVGVGESLLLLERLNALNANMHFVRFCFTHGGVVVDLELPADHFSAPLLEAACLAISQAAETVGPELQQDVGGRLFFSDESVLPSPRGTAGYL